VLSKIFLFAIQQCNLIVCLDFSLVGYDPIVSYLFAGISMSIIDEGKVFDGGDLKNEW